MAMENSQLINNFPTNTSIYRGCSTATFDYRRLTQTSEKKWSFFHLLGNSSESGTCRDFFWSDHLKPQICWTYTGSHGISHNLTCNSCPIFGEHHFYVLEKSFFHPFGVHGLLIIWGASKKISVWSCVTPWCFSGWSRWQNPKFPVHPGAIFDTDLFCTFVRPGGFGMKGDC